MSNFESLRNISIGQYLPIDSWVNRLDARTRLVSITLIIFAAIYSSHPWGLFIGISFVLCGLVLARIPIRYAFRNLLPPLPFLIILAVVQIIFNFRLDSSPIVVQVGSLAVSQSDLWAGLVLILRFVIIILGLSLGSYCISTSDLTLSLESLLYPLSRLGLPTYDFVMVMQVTLQFIPFMALVTERIVKAQAARGQDWDTPKSGLFQRVKRIVPILVPLTLISLRRAENLALAMDARGYGTSTKRTSLGTLRFEARDLVVLAVTTVSILGMILL